MRVLMKVQMGPGGMTGAPAGNGGPSTLGQMIDRLQPEAAYFYPEGGHRTAVIVFDLQNLADMPTIAEPVYRAGAERIDWSPAMNFEELQAGISRVSQAASPA